jgi:hypothetical protein
LKIEQSYFNGFQSNLELEVEIDCSHIDLNEVKRMDMRDKWNLVSFSTGTLLDFITTSIGYQYEANPVVVDLGLKLWSLLKTALFVSCVSMIFLGLHISAIYGYAKIKKIFSAMLFCAALFSLLVGFSNIIFLFAR